MYISSKYHDYYDSAIGLGIDKTVVYVRKIEELPQLSKIQQNTLYNICEKLPYGQITGRSTDSYGVHGCLLIICGEVVPFIRIHDNNKKDHYFYQFDKLNDYLNANNMCNGRYYSFWRERHTVGSREGMKKFLSTKDFSKASELLHLHKVPIIMVQRNHPHQDLKITSNPILKEISYQTQKDPYTVFQNIFMYISGVLGIDQRPMIKVSDEVLAAKRGHDGPYSFKNVPGKKRGRT
jgi:hypothetical protein